MLWNYHKKFYDVLSQLKATVATPTLANAGKPHHQLSSCFIDTVGDNLEGIMDTAKSAAKVSKYGGGVGIYVGKIRGRASNIRTHKGVAAGVIPFTKIYNQVALAFDQVGQRAGAFAIYNDIWHSDILDFLDMKTNNGDERMKAHDIFPGVCIPDIFMEALEAREDWYLFDPHEIKQKMGFLLEDAYDDDHNKEFSRRYWACVANKDLHRVVVPAIEIMKKIMKSSFETGTPFIFYRDTVNKANPNKHAGMIYSSNLCVEIMQNMSAQEFISETITSEEGETFIVTKVKPGDFVVCNLSSLNLGNVESPEDIDNTVSILMRMMDNVIDLNFYPVPNAEVTNKKYRAVGLGTSGYHQYLALNGVMWESEQHLAVADELYEHIAYCAIKASNLIAMEKGSYSLFKGSEWHTGIYFARRGYITIDEEGIYHPVKGKERWYHLAISVRTHGMRNAWVFAVAPTGSTSIIAGSTASIDPIFSKYFMEEKKDGIVPEIAPQLSPKTIWYYKEAHQIDQQWSIKAAGKRQLHIDQSQSFNLYITPDTSAKELLNMYTESWKYGLKTIYYVRNKSLDATDCVVCT
jgi:ribonucleoside-diphosphate reductase alpha chain